MPTFSAILLLAWLALLVSAAPTVFTDVTMLESEAPTPKPEPGSPNLIRSALFVDVKVRDGYLVASPRSKVDSTTESEDQLAERGITLVKRWTLFWYFVPESACVRFVIHVT